MSSASRHYETLLSEHYSWMFGDADARVAAERRLLERLGLTGGGRALDMGCGLGFQALALADLGWTVVAVGASRRLLAELKRRIGPRLVEPRLGDIEELPPVEAESFDAVLCMEDTLSHLTDRDAIASLLGRAYEALKPGGRLVVTFRDRGEALTGLDRFVSEHGDLDRVMTSFLEYEAETVMVYTLVHVKDEDGWTMSKSCHRKLRLTPAWVAAALATAGFTVAEQIPSGRLHAVVARR